MTIVLLCLEVVRIQARETENGLKHIIIIYVKTGSDREMA